MSIIYNTLLNSVKNIGLNVCFFGSILTDRFNDNSDIDFSVDFDREAIIADKLDWANLFFDFIDELQNLLKRKVDIVFDDYINNQYFRKELDSTKQLIYG